MENLDSAAAGNPSGAAEPAAPAGVDGARVDGTGADGTGERGDPVAEHLYRIEHTAGSSDLVEAAGVSEETLDEIAQLMNALVRLREAETRLSEASRKYMKLSEQDMRALHYLIIARQRGEIITPGMIAAHLRISAASTTKLLNRLERDGHIVRRLHPRDRRAFMIEVTPETEATAQQTVGRQQARRFYAAARLTREERATVTRFLDDMANELSLGHVDWADASDPASDPGSEPAETPREK